MASMMHRPQTQKPKEGQRKFSPPGPTYMSDDQIGMFTVPRQSILFPIQPLSISFGLSPLRIEVSMLIFDLQRPI
ncbi:uncharacterized protein BO66DRAFT_390177 [Aspergillus aculeatinus CBS 121060]|uniref:Uncharacterized protein n=1 Tax=Aspergillus aculeatinus CBS 121060 TaxID=1448322 RepID=A0ACD1HFB0_9EURO|nr:hypothetical protein BO66DRAFT_390177 [Aspergillus aculeatinus CBS 121060]RAH72056.1 hypothetical protein BO66DRAFT_390177 [Aspergillus aculeatinus CBS 121060]